MNTLPQLGPLMDEDAALLQAIIRMTNPKLIIEFGYFWGKSARAMLEVMDKDARLISYDNTQEPERVIGEMAYDPRFSFEARSQEDVQPVDTQIDFVFFDASHELELNKKTFLAIKDNLSEKAIVAVHDTGTWAGGNVFNVKDGEADEKGNWVHRPDEIDFVNWIKEQYPDFQQIHFHSSTSVRHGITLLQKYVCL